MWQSQPRSWVQGPDGQTRDKSPGPAQPGQVLAPRAAETGSACRHIVRTNRAEHSYYLL